MSHYTTLGVDKTATSEEIHKAYRKLARQHHPDRNPGDESAADRFKQVQEAYDVLKDPLKKSQYDSGFIVRNRPGPPPRPQPQPPKPPKTKEDFEREKAEAKRKKERAASPTAEDLNNINCTFIAGGSTGRHILVQLKLTPEEMQRGGNKSVIIKKRDLCKRCIGDGRAMIACPMCRGHRDQVGHCPRCHGYGAEEQVCGICNGEGVYGWTVQEVAVRFSPKVQPGHTITVLGEGEAAPHKAPGNLRVVIV
jgi:molecular chaperone DnaJ